MFSKIMGKKKEGDTQESKILNEVSKKIEPMNLTEMRTYVNNKILNFEVSTVGLFAIMNKLTLADASTGRYYLVESDMDVKKKKAFDLVLMIAESKKIDLKVLESIQNFVEVYAHLIAKFDNDNKQIYASRFKDMLEQAIKGFTNIAKEQNKMNVLRN